MTAIHDQFEAMLADFTREAQSDWIGLWAILRELRENNPQLSSSDVRRETLEFVTYLLAHGFEVGDPPYSPSGYRRWERQDREYVISRIDREWQTWGKEPNIPDIAWFGLSSH